MTYISDAELQRDLSRYLDEVVDDRAPVVVMRGKGNVVMVSEADWAGWQETAYLLSSPKNAELLLQGVRDAEAGAMTEHELLPSADQTGR